MKKIFKLVGFIAFIAVIGLAFSACYNGNGNGKDTHTHDWQWVVTTEGSPTEDRIETKTCSISGETDGTRIVPIDRETTITDLFGESYTATVKGTFTLAEFATVTDKVKTAFNTAFNSVSGPGANGNKNGFRAVFGDNVVIFVEKNPSYANYKIVAGAYRALYLNVDSDMDAATLRIAMVAMYNEDGTNLIGKAPPLKDVHIIKFT